MATHSMKLTLNARVLRGFRSHGLMLDGLSDTGRLARNASIEGPTSILSQVEDGAFLQVGAFCNLSGGTLNNVVTGRYCSVARGVAIGSHEHPTDWLTTSRTAYYPEVNGWDRLMAGTDARAIRARAAPFMASCPVTTLGPDVWIGHGAFIKAGVSIGAGAIVGARATVVKDVPPFAVVVGTPARVLRLRFAEPVVERLLQVRWWRYSIYDLFDASMDDIEPALDLIEENAACGKLAPYEGPVLTAEDLTEPSVALAALEERSLALAS